MSDDSSARGTPWGRQPGETSKAYEAFTIYLGLGTRRSIERAVEAAGKRPTVVGSWERWSARWRWVERATLYDTDQLEGQIAGRQVAREKVRQAAFDEAHEIYRELRELSTGHMRPGQQQIQTDREGNPKTVPVERDGEIVQVAVTKELVSPKTRADILIKLLGYAGIVEPVKGTWDVNLPGAADGLRDALRGLDPELLVGIMNLLGVGGDKPG